jgi:IS30 family transposase
MIREFFPKGTYLNTISQIELNDVSRLMNQQPRKTLGRKNPKKPLPQISRPSDQPLHLELASKSLVTTQKF